GGQRVRPARPLPVRGTAAVTSRITAVYDKGKAAVLVLRTEAADADGPLWTDEAEIYVRGAGGWGGERGPSGRAEVPGGEPDAGVGPGAGVEPGAVAEPDAVVERRVREEQALLYRLSGDW
ncbi:hypothetical protein NGM37_35775, partial [Streptomyces sp. TRM76130]|nr:hypothetical protein [Streptomyces sp. TRM76130]